MTWPEMDLFAGLMKRTEPGPGAEMPDSGLPGSGHLKMRSIPNVDTERLLRTRLWLHDQLHTVIGLRDWDQSRRQLANAGLRVRAINHELKLRGYRGNGCRFCDEGRDDLSDDQRTPDPNT